jgi:diguanylate cyclase (GGDEF)-like protein
MMMSAVPEAALADAAADAAMDGLFARMFPALAERDGQWWAVQDAQTGAYVRVSTRMAAFARREPALLLGRTDNELFDATVATALRAAEHTALAQAEPLLSEHRFDWAGTRHELSVLRLASPPDAIGRRWLCSVWADLGVERRQQAQLQAALQQLEQQQRANEELRREMADQALRDSTSGLFSRAHFEDQLRREVDLSTREHREFALVFIEIDPHAEKVRALGEMAHTRVLEAMGRLLRGGTRAMDASCRLSDRRFAVLLSGVGLATSHSRMEGLRRKCATQIVVLDGQELGFTVSMGVASFPHTAHSQEELLSSSEKALAEAQRRGGNHVTLASIRFEPG